MSEGLFQPPPRRCRRNVAKLLRMRHALVGASSFGNGEDELPLGVDRQFPMAVPHLHHAAGRAGTRRQPIEHTVIAHKAIPTDLALLTRPALPGPATRQRLQGFLSPALNRTLTSGAMDTLIAPLIPGPSLAIEVVHIAEGNAGPEVLFDNADTPFDLALGLRRVGL